MQKNYRDQSRNQILFLCFMLVLFNFCKTIHKVFVKHSKNLRVDCTRLRVIEIKKLGLLI
jgi:hypothetical protein